MTANARALAVLVLVSLALGPPAHAKRRSGSARKPNAQAAELDGLAKEAYREKRWEDDGGGRPGAERAPDPGGGASWLALGSLGAGAALLVGGGVVGLMASQDETARDELIDESKSRDVSLSEYQDKDDAARSKALVSNVLLGTGALAAAVGAVLWLTADDGAAGWVGWAPAPGGAAVVVGGRL